MREGNMPPGSDRVIDSALGANWQSGLIALVCLFASGLAGWAFVFVVRRLYGRGGYKERCTVAEERVADRQVEFIGYMQDTQQHRDEMCERHTTGIQTIAKGLETHDRNCDRLCDAVQKQTDMLKDSDGITGAGRRLEESAIELADIALLLFEKQWGELTEAQQDKVRERLKKVKDRHTRTKR